MSDDTSKSKKLVPFTGAKEQKKSSGNDGDGDFIHHRFDRIDDDIRDIRNKTGEMEGALKFKADKNDIFNLRNDVQYVKGALDHVPGNMQYWVGIVVIVSAIITSAVAIAYYLS